MNALIHPAALVESEHVGEGTRIWAFVHVMRDVVIGTNCNIGDHCFIESGASLGDGVTLKNGNMVWEGVRLDDGVFVGPHVFFTNDLHPRSPRLPEAQPRYATKSWLAKTLVKRGASLGAGAVILGGVTVGEYAMVAAAAVVTRDVAPYALVMGNPARRRGWVCQCGQSLKLDDGGARCGACGRTYRESDGGLRLA